MPTDPVWSDTATTLAIRICREIYLLTHGNAAKWQPLTDVLQRFRLEAPELKTALQCGVAKGWLEAVGNPAFSVRLLNAGHAMFVEENPTLPLSRRRPRS